FLTGEKALTPENVAAASRFGAWVKSRGLPGPAPVAVAWVLSRPQVTSAIIGASRVAQLEQNVKALDVKLGDADWKEAEAAIATAAAAGATARSGAAGKRVAAREGEAEEADVPAKGSGNAGSPAPDAGARATRPVTPAGKARRPVTPARAA